MKENNTYWFIVQLLTLILGVLAMFVGFLYGTAAFKIFGFIILAISVVIGVMIESDK